MYWRKAFVDKYMSLQEKKCVCVCVREREESGKAYLYGTVKEKHADLALKAEMVVMEVEDEAGFVPSMSFEDLAVGARKVVDGSGGGHDGRCDQARPGRFPRWWWWWCWWWW